MRAGHSNVGFRRSTAKRERSVFDAGNRSSMTTTLGQPLKCMRNTYFPLGETIGYPLSKSNGNINDGNNCKWSATQSSVCRDYGRADWSPGLSCFIAAQRLATTEQSVVISWTRSMSSFAHMRSSLLFGSAVLRGASNKSRGRFQLAKASR